jgi:diaminopimelate epimerase
MRVELRQGRVERVRVDMGEPYLPPRNMDLELGDAEFSVTALSMGNPHCVAFVDRLDTFDVSHWGPLIERHPAFPDRTNVEFVEIVDPQHVRQRTWERGSGETLACGSGACAVCVAGALTGRTQRTIEVEMAGGTLQIEWDVVSNRVHMTGPAAEVFTGEWPDG